MLAAVFVVGWLFSRFAFARLWGAGRSVGVYLRAAVLRVTGRSV